MVHPWHRTPLPNRQLPLVWKPLSRSPAQAWLHQGRTGRDQQDVRSGLRSERELIRGDEHVVEVNVERVAPKDIEFPGPAAHLESQSIL